jgi:ribosomal protein S18 acetylase RimI-like enzyme
MHREWIANSIRGQIADQVLVAEYRGIPVGFVTLEIDKDASKCLGRGVGHIPLIGTHPSYRGRGIAVTLTEAAIGGFFKKNRVDLVRIETQLSNIPASRTYEKLGFRIVDAGQTLRWFARDP